MVFNMCTTYVTSLVFYTCIFYVVGGKLLKKRTLLRVKNHAFYVKNLE